MQDISFIGETIELIHKMETEEISGGPLLATEVSYSLKGWPQFCYFTSAVCQMRGIEAIRKRPACPIQYNEP